MLFHLFMQTLVALVYALTRDPIHDPDTNPPRCLARANALFSSNTATLVYEEASPPGHF